MVALERTMLASNGGMEDGVLEGEPGGQKIMN